MNILIVDDEKSLLFALSELFESEGYNVIAVPDAEEALKKLQSEQIEIAILDYHLPGLNGFELLNIIKESYSWIQVIMVTAFGSEDVAIQAIRSGAYDYIAKPFNNETLLNRVKHIKQSLEGNSGESETKFGHYFSPAMKSIIEKLKTLSATDIPILVTGESGTGKELLSRICHHHSGRDGRFLSVNCSALPASLIESELFGAEKGSYTGAASRKKGLFEMADGGTIFLDEIGEMPFEMQAKILRVLQEGEITRIGSGVPIKINTRVIAATNRNLQEEIVNKNFREDLYYRLNVVEIELPPLRNRAEEIEPLSSMFLQEFNRKYDKQVAGFDEILLEEMTKYGWPGNIRELRNKIEKAVVLCNREWISKEYLTLTTEQPQSSAEPSEKGESNASVDSIGSVVIGNDELHINFSSLPSKIVQAKREVVEQFEKSFILSYLNKNSWNVKQTADQIGLCRQDLYKKMKKLGIQKEVKYI